jgi:beta-galactosidase
VFAEDQIPVDFISTQDAIAGRMRDYKVVFIPFPVMMSRDVADAIKTYVQNGGTAIAEARLGWNDERGYASDVIPGFGLDEVFGAREGEMRPVEKPALSIADWSPGIQTNLTAFGEGFQETLVARGNAKILAKFSDGSAAIVENQYGKGRAVLIGTFMAMAVQRENGGVGHLWLQSLAGGDHWPDAITRPVTQHAEEIEVRMLVGPRDRFLFVFNHGDRPNDLELPLAESNPAAAVDLITNAPIPLRRVIQGLTISKRLQPGEVWVVRISSRDGKG